MNAWGFLSVLGLLALLTWACPASGEDVLSPKSTLAVMGAALQSDTPSPSHSRGKMIQTLHRLGIPALLLFVVFTQSPVAFAAGQKDAPAPIEEAASPEDPDRDSGASLEISPSGTVVNTSSELILYDTNTGVVHVERFQTQNGPNGMQIKRTHSTTRSIQFQKFLDTLKKVQLQAEDRALELLNSTVNGVRYLQELQEESA